MRKKKFFCAFAAIFILVTSNFMALARDREVYLSDDTVAGIHLDDFETIPLTDERIQEIWNNMELKEIKEPYQDAEAFTSFDVSKNDTVALGLKNNKVIVLDSNNTVIKQFSSESDGSFYVRWKGDRLVLFFARASLIVETTLSGELVNMLEYLEPSISNNDLWRAITAQRPIKIHGNLYKTQNPMGGFGDLIFAQSYPQLIKIDENGNTTMVYDASGKQIPKAITIFCMILTFVFTCIGGLIWQIKKYARLQSSITK